MKLYREQGAQGLDFSYLDAADKLARRRDILLEEALDEARHERPEEKLTDAGRRSGSLISLVLGAIFLGLAFYVNPYVFTNPVEILTAQGEGQTAFGYSSS